MFDTTLGSRSLFARPTGAAAALACLLAAGMLPGCAADAAPGEPAPAEQVGTQQAADTFYEQAEQILWDECPALWQSHTVNLFGINSRVTGFKALADMCEDMRGLQIKG